MPTTPVTAVYHLTGPAFSCCMHTSAQTTAGVPLIDTRDLCVCILSAYRHRLYTVHDLSMAALAFPESDDDRFQQTLAFCHRQDNSALQVTWQCLNLDVAETLASYSHACCMLHACSRCLPGTAQSAVSQQLASQQVNASSTQLYRFNQATCTLSTMLSVPATQHTHCQEVCHGCGHMSMQCHAAMVGCRLSQCERLRRSA